jgi:hypothetical protein
MHLISGIKTVTKVKNALATESKATEAKHVAVKKPTISSAEQFLIDKYRLKKGKKVALVYYPSSRDLRMLPSRKQINLKSAVEIAIKHNVEFSVRHSTSKADLTSEFLTRYLINEFGLFLKSQNATVLLKLINKKSKVFAKVIKAFTDK